MIGDIGQSEDSKDNKVHIEIYNKETGEVVDIAEKYHDEAERWAKNYIWGRKYLAYKIITVI